MRTKYELPFVPSGAVNIQDEYLSNFNEENDLRTQMILKGKQYLSNVQAIIIKTTKKGFNVD